MNNRILHLRYYDQELKAMIVKYDLDANTKLTPEQIKALNELDDLPDCYDDETPPLTIDQLSKFKRINACPVEE